jgi:2-C-methyl-D-erythritol 4-phosphate cytidylyltransferase
MGSEIPKQFLELGGEPVLRSSFRTLIRWRSDGRFYCVANGDFFRRTDEILNPLRLQFNIRIEVIPGGATRHASTLAGIAALKDSAPSDLIFLHDAARPCITNEELDRLLEAFQDPTVEIASLVSPITDTVVRGTPLPGIVTERLNREELFGVKTPQALRVSALEKLLSLEESPDFTDLLSWGDAAGIRGHTILSGPHNVKLTGPGDIPIIEAILRHS